MTVLPKQSVIPLGERVCPGIAAKPTVSRLDEIAAAIARGADPESFQEELDELLGTTMDPRNTVAEEVYETARKKANE